MNLYLSPTLGGEKKDNKLDSKYCIKYAKITNNSGIKIKREIDGKINLWFYCINGCFEKLELLMKKQKVIY